MYRLTTNRLAKAKPILEKYRRKLYEDFSFDARMLEKELKECWDLGYQEIKQIAEEMLNMPRYKYVAIYYMEHGGAPGVVSEFQGLLAAVYGIRDYHAPDRDQISKELWARFRRRHARNE